MKLTVEVSKKIGLPNYGSSSATVGIVFDAPDSMGDDLPALRKQLVTLQHLCHDLVEDHIAAQGGQGGHSEVRLVEAPAPGPRLAPTSTAEPSAPRSTARMEPTKPANGCELYGWLNDRDKEFGTQLVLHVMDWARTNKIRGKIRDFDQTISERAYDEAKRVLDDQARRFTGNGARA